MPPGFEGVESEAMVNDRWLLRDATLQGILIDTAMLFAMFVQFAVGNRYHVNHVTQAT